MLVALVFEDQEELLEQDVDPADWCLVGPERDIAAGLGQIGQSGTESQPGLAHRVHMPTDQPQARGSTPARVTIRP